MYNKYTRKTLLFVFLAAAIYATSGCSSMLTIGNSDNEGCKGIPESSGKCMSVMEVYQKTSNGQPLVKMKEGDQNSSEVEQGAVDSDDVKKDDKTSEKANKSNSITVVTGNNPIPVRMQSKVMRVWINSYESSSGDFVAPGFIYTEIEPKKWTLGQKITSDGQKVDPLKSASRGLAKK